MTTLVDMQSSVPTENWDEDFEFHASPNNDKRVPIPSHPTRASTTSTAFTEDWDRDTDAAPLHESRPSDMNATQFQQEKENLHLANWAEAGPSTPTKPHFPSSTENWDDDFEDRLGDSPARKPRPININSKKPHPSSPSRSQFEQESWDEEFDLASPTTSPKTKLFTNTNDHNTPDDDNMHDDEDEDDMDFNFQDKDEEDRTVTARSRRGALARLTTSHLPHANTTPPPPVPPIPASLLTTDISSVGLHFPRSPTGSVFSAPSVNSGRDSVAYSYYHNNSTTHLRPTVSRQSGGGFANLPPSPPIHKERERRRLRKKSRPDPSGQDDSLRQPLPQSVNASTESIGLRPRPVTPQTPPRSSSPQLPSSAEPSSTPSTSNGNRNSIQPGSSPPTKTPLLSRIGSVKKWGVRKKRASSTPSELMLQEDSQDSSTHMNGSDPSTSRSPSKSGNWFFRVTSGGGPAEIGRKSSSAPAVDESEEDAEASKSAYTPKARKVATASNLETNPDTASKLVKRKSSGFMPLRRNKGPMNDNSVMYEAGELPSDLEHELGLDSDVALGRSPSKRKKQSTAQPTARPTAGSSRQPSYGGLGLGRAGKGFESSSDDLTEKEPMRSRARSFSRSKHKEPALDEKEGQRSFMGSVRRISLVGIHKRTKSGVSLVEGAGKGPSSSHRKQSEGDDPMDVDSESHPSSRTPSRSSGLLPPIELQPPSPPRTVVDRSTGKTARAASPNNLDTLLHASNAPSTSSPSLVLKPTGSPQAASLGRSTVVPAIVGSSAILRDSNVPRRNSLGDLKIPARISQAQVGLRRDLGMVREFASNVEQLKELQATYNALLMEVQGVLDAYAQQASSRATSPNFFGLPLSRPRSNAQGPGQPPQQAYKQLAAAFYTINSKYRIAWECAELLIELGTGSTGASPPSTSVSVPTMATTFSSKNRERAITLSGEESKPPTPVPGQVSSSQSAGPPIASPPSMSWRASTGRHDLSQRQLLLLREMLNNPDTSQVIDPQQLPTPDESSPVNRDWRWGEGMNSTVTLPSEESSAQGGSHNGDAPAKKRRTSKLVGMSGFRDMLRALKRSQVEAPALPASSTSLSTESSSVESSGQRYAGKVPTYGRRRAKTSSGPELDRSRSPYGASVSLSAKQSPRRPSLASIFRIGGKSKQTTPSSTHNASTVDLSVENLHEQRRQKDNGSSGGDDDDWDHVSDLDHGAGGARTREATATIRGRSPYLQDLQLPSSQIPSRPQTPKSRSNSASHSQTSLQWEGLPPPSVGIPSRTNRLSNVEETVEDSRTPHKHKAAARKAAPSPSRPPSRSKNVSKTGSVRSMPPQPLGGLPDVKLAMTPENIKPLLENSKEVHNRLTECIAEIRQLLPVE